MTGPLLSGHIAARRYEAAGQERGVNVNTFGVGEIDFGNVTPRTPLRY